MDMRNIGDKVFLARFEREKEYEKCPDCFGKLYLTVILGDDSSVTIDCMGCASGYDPPTGRVLIYTHKPSVNQATITGVSRRSEGGMEYTFYCSSYAKENDVFSTHEAAMVRAQELAKEHDEEERKRVFRKDKDHRTWAWNVTYYRREIKSLEERLVHYREKLDAAKFKFKK